MRHRKKKTTLDRKAGPRKALLRSLAESLVLHEKIKTTEAKARALKPIVEKMVSRAKKGDLAARRELLRFLYTEKAVKYLIDTIAPRFQNRKGGYTRLIKIGPRLGDSAREAVIEFIE